MIVLVTLLWNFTALIFTILFYFILLELKPQIKKIIEIIDLVVSNLLL
jgi:hypothetical protein